MVWLNGNLVGGWPFGYASWRLDLTPYLNFDEKNQLAIRLDNPPESSRWYPGGGLYRNVWLTKTNPVHVAHWGTYVTTPEVSEESATVDLEVTIDNDTKENTPVKVFAEIYELAEEGNKSGSIVESFEVLETTIPANAHSKVNGTVVIENPNLWGPSPTQIPHRYKVVTNVYQNGMKVDEYETKFGIRTIEMDPERGVIVNGEHVHLKGANQHHDLGALGAAFNVRAAERQLDKLQEMGANAIRMAHNPPAPELLELTDKMGFLVIDESFDAWERRKAPLDFHLIFPDWHEQVLRALVRRDRNHPSIIAWSTGNEVGEQYTGEAGAELSMKLRNIVNDEDPTRLTTVSMNYAKPPMKFPDPVELISLNYQGEGIRDEG
jgi:beta-galactosidase